MKIFFIVLYTIALPLSLFAQSLDRYTISGSVRDAATGEDLIGATVFVTDVSSNGTPGEGQSFNPVAGVMTNAYGFYSLTVPTGNYSVTAQYIGYEPKSLTIELNKNVSLDFVISESSTQLKEVVINAENENISITKTQMGVEKLDIKEIEKIPVLFGERDVLKTIQLRPGVKTAGEGSSGFYVRGGAADQNLILLDEATVYNASHLLGFFSVFNSDALKDVTLYKGGQPAEYGGRLSSVLDIRMNEGNDKKFGVEGGIGLIASRVKVEGPIVKNKGSFVVSARRTYLDLLLKLSPDSLTQQARLYFYDLNAKANYRLNDKNRIFLSGYFGKDVLGLGETFGFDWGNATGTFRWNRIVNDKLFSNTSVIYSNYNYNIDLEFGSIEGRIISRIRDYNLKQDFEYFSNSENSFKFGFNSIYHKIVPGAITIRNDENFSELKLINNQSWENALYVSHEWKPTQFLNFEYGIRGSLFSAVGPGQFYTYNEDGEPTDTTSYGSGQFVKTYFNPEPRVAANFIINSRSSVKASYGRNTQNLHLLSNSTSGNPTDLWIPSSNNVKPEIADQVSLGYFRNFRDNGYEFSSEVYYKYLQNQIDYKDGAELSFNQNVEAELLPGTGRAYGIEFFLKKKHGRLNGWIGYTLARTEKKIEGINQGQYYPARQDRTHDVSVVAIYTLTEKLSLSGTWVYYTGNAVTFPSGKYSVAGQVVNYYTERNGYRMPAYHRLDLGITWVVKNQ